MSRTIIGNRHYVALFLPADWNSQALQECIAANMKAVSVDPSAIIETDERRAKLLNMARIPVVRFHVGLIWDGKVKEVYMQQVDYSESNKGIAAPMMPTPWGPSGRNAIAGFRSALPESVRERLFDAPSPLLREI